MKITGAAISLNVDDPAASAAFARQHLGFGEAMSGDGFVSLSRPDVDRAAVQDMLGHATDAMTRRYSGAVRQRTAAAMMLRYSTIQGARADESPLVAISEVPCFRRA